MSKKVENPTLELVLCIFLGIFGVHKFYEGKTGLGLVYLFTGGLFGIGWMIDIVILFIAVLNEKPSKPVTEVKTSTATPSASSYMLHSTRKFVDDYVVFDLETTGFDPYTDKIIEIGALKYQDNNLVAKFSELVNPQTFIPEKITQITGISDNDVKSARTIEEVLPDFLNFIEDYPLVAHNNSFDVKFLLANLQAQKLDCISNKTIDTLSLSRKYLPNLKDHKLETLKKYFKLDNISHRSIADCEVTNVVYQYCKTGDKR